MTGKQKCRMLKEIRQRIADENDIPYVTRECRFQGECTGTCPRCESELRYLERELEKRRSLKKKVTVAALCAGMVIASAGCSSIGIGKGQELSGEVPYENTGYAPEDTTADGKDTTDGTDGNDIVEETGEVAWPEGQEGSTVTNKTESTEVYVTTGEVPYPESDDGTSENVEK